MPPFFPVSAAVLRFAPCGNARPPYGARANRYFLAVLLAAVLAAAWPSATPIVASNPPLGHRFDGHDLVWQLLEDRTGARLLAHERVPGGGRDRGGCERVVVAAPAGYSTHLICPGPRVAVLDELTVRLWIKASRPDVQVAARIAMPRSTDAHGRMATALVRGESYGQPGQWQQLSLTNVPKILAAEVRIMRSGSSAIVDPKEAFVEKIVLIVPGEPNGVEMFTDDLEIEGVVVERADAVQLANFEAPPMPAVPSASLAEAPVHGAVDSHGNSSTAVRLHGSLLLVEGRPFLPRIIEWQGESLEFLAKQGFNTIQLPAPPTAEQIAEATRHSLWFLCTALKPDAIVQQGIGQADDRVLAWLLEDASIETDPEYGRNWSATIRRHDAVGGRPIVIAPESQWQSGGKAADLLLARHPRLAAMSAAECDEWLESRPWLTRPGMPLWVCIPTQFSGAVQQQAAALAADLAPQQQVDEDRIEQLVRTACMRGTRGFYFASTSPLDEENPQARHRAAVLQLGNRFLQLVEPWLAGGKTLSRIHSSDSTWTGVVLHVDRARLLMPVATQVLQRTGGIASALVPSAKMPADDEIVFVVPGVPESSQVFLLSPVAFRPLTARRIAGGTRIVIPTGADHMVLITEDPQVVHTFRQRIVRDGPEIARLERTLAGQRTEFVAETGRRLAQIGYSIPAATRAVDAAPAQLRQCDALLASGNIEPAHQLLHSARREINQAADEQRRSVQTVESLISHPLALSYDGLVDFARFMKSFPTMRGGENLLYGGDFEDLGQITQFGWQHVSHPTAGVHAAAKLSTNDPKHGAYCVELFVGANLPKSEPGALESAPVWIVSPPVPVEKDQVIEITGWVRVTQPIIGSVDGLQIIDTIGGGELSLAVRQTAGWQPFRIIRGVPGSTELRLTFALTGLGTAAIDGVMVRTLQQPVARRLPATTPADLSNSNNTARHSGPLFLAPQSR